jgi:oxalate decarboxylase
VENTGDDDLVFIEMFKDAHYRDLSLSTWVSHAPEQLIIDHLRISPETLHAIPHGDSTVVPS